MHPRSTFQPNLETLESRDMLAAGITAHVQFDNLIIDGTVGNDYISVTQSAGRLSVYGVSITVGNTKTGSIAAGSVARVVINGYAGNDIIIASTLTKDAIVAGGPGNDSIYGGAGNDLLDGGAGDDLIYGDAGNDRLTAGVSPNEHDTLLGGTGFDWYYRPFNPNTPVVGGASAADIHQGEAPLCQTAGALAEAANQGHNFAADLRYLGGNTYQVKMYGSLATQKVYFDGWTNDQDLVMANGEFWFVLLQRARLQAHGINPTEEYSQANWDAWNVKTRNRLYSIGEALYGFTGSTSAFYTIGAANAQTLKSTLERGNYVIAQSSAGSSLASSDGVIRSHAYAVLGVYQEGGVWKVRLYNPWGMDRENGSTLDALDRTSANDGIITLSWQQFIKTTNFKGFYLAAKK